MNTIEKALMHGLFVHLHHNIDKVIDFKGFQELNRKVDKIGLVLWLSVLSRMMMLQFSRYQEMPKNIADEIVAKVRGV